MRVRSDDCKMQCFQLFKLQIVVNAAVEEQAGCLWFLVVFKAVTGALLQLTLTVRPDLQ